MAGYYEQLETQLTQATERGVSRRRRFAPRRRSRFMGRPRGDRLAVAFALALALAVVVVFTQVGVKHVHRRPTPATHSGRLPVIRNYAPGEPPAMGGQLYCDAALSAPGGAARPTGRVVVNTRPPAGYVFRITASGLMPSPPGKVYEVWLRPATRAFNTTFVPLNGEAPVLAGRIAPPIGSSGRLAAQGVSRSGLAAGDYLLLITLQSPSATKPGHIVLQGDLPL